MFMNYADIDNTDYGNGIQIYIPMAILYTL